MIVGTGSIIIATPGQVTPVPVTGNGQLQKLDAVGQIQRATGAGRVN
jgi:hypothetical protein